MCMHWPTGRCCNCMPFLPLSCAVLVQVLSHRAQQDLQDSETKPQAWPQEEPQTWPCVSKRFPTQGGFCGPKRWQKINPHQRTMLKTTRGPRRHHVCNLHTWSISLKHAFAWHYPLTPMALPLLHAGGGMLLRVVAYVALVQHL